METITGTAISETLFGDAGNNRIEGGFGNDSLFGGAGDDFLDGGEGNDILAGGIEPGNLDSIITVGGKDTLSGGMGSDGYFVSAVSGGGTEIREAGGIADVLLIFADVDSAESIASLNPSDFIGATEAVGDPESYGDAAIVLDFPQPGVVGLQKSETDLIIDINRDGVAEAENDLTVVDFFDEQGQLGSGSLDLINNILDPQSIADFFQQPEGTVYRFFNNETGVHFYTASATERDSLLNNPSSFSYENTSYRAIDPLTGNSEATSVYRFLNQDTGVHLYTIDENERDFLQTSDNFSFEGEAFSAYQTQVEGSIPIYRFFNSTTGAHFYTPSASERDAVADLPDYQSEGIAYYALPIAEESF